MHHALNIEEILVQIFSYCGTPVRGTLRRRIKKRHNRYANVRLITLARTCKVFKEPALDMIWSELDDLTPLVRCLPNESWEVHGGEPGDDPRLMYSLKKPLDRSDWNVIIGYARRVRVLRCLYGSFGLAAVSIEALSKPPAPTESIFPNLHTIGLFTPSASVESLIRHFGHPKVVNIMLQDCGDLSTVAIESFGKACPLVTYFDTLYWAGSSDAISNLVCGWQDLRVVKCHGIALNADAVLHLSRLPRLTCMNFRIQEPLVGQICAAKPFLTLPTLQDIYLSSPSLTLVCRFLRCFNLPIACDISVALDFDRITPDLMPFFTSLQKVCNHILLRNLFLYVPHRSRSSVFSVENLHPYYITFHRLLPLTVFTNIRSIILNVPCGVDLNERDLLTLASSWPRLEEFKVGADYDWTMTSAITPDGFLQLLERCRSLRTLHFMLDTRGFTDVPQGHPWRGLKMPKHTFIHLLNSPIEEESINAIGVFFRVAPYPNFILTTHWNNSFFQGSARPEELCDLYYDRWVHARNIAHRLWEERKDLRRSLESGDILTRRVVS